MSVMVRSSSRLAGLGLENRQWLCSWTRSYWLSAHRAEDEEIVAIVETDACSCDVVQVITGCTFGKGNLLYRDYGKTQREGPIGATKRRQRRNRGHHRHRQQQQSQRLQNHPGPNSERQQPNALPAHRVRCESSQAVAEVAASLSPCRSG
mgnify:CR=1 FL=1